MKLKTTQELVRKCFCARCSMMPLYKGYCGKSDCKFVNWKAVGRAARKFVRMEIRQKQIRDYRPGDTFEDKGVP